MADEEEEKNQPPIVAPPPPAPGYGSEAMDIVRGAASPMPGSMVIPAAKMGAHVASDVGNALAPAVQGLGAQAQQAYGLSRNPLAPLPADAAEAPPGGAGVSAPVTSPLAQAKPVTPQMMPTESTTSQEMLSKTDSKKLGEDFAAKTQADAAMTQNQVSIWQKQQDMQRQAQQDEAAKRAAEDARMATQQQDLDKAMGEGHDLAQKIGVVDPKKLNKDMGVGGNIAAALGMALGTFGSGITHGPNTAMEVYKNAVDNDIRAQEKNIESAKDKAQLQNNRIAKIMELGHDQRSAIALDRASRFADLQRSLEEKANESGDVTIKQKAAQTAAMAKQEYDKSMSQFQAIKKNTISQLRNPNGVEAGKALPEKAIDESADRKDARQQLDLLEKQYNSAKGPTPVVGGLLSKIGGTESADYENARSALTVPLAKAVKGSNYRPGDEDHFLDQIPGASSTHGNGKNQFARLRAMLIRGQNNSQGTYAKAGYNTAPLGGGSGAPASFKPTE